MNKMDCLIQNDKYKKAIKAVQEKIAIIESYPHDLQTAYLVESDKARLDNRLYILTQQKNRLSDVFDNIVAKEQDGRCYGNFQES